MDQAIPDATSKASEVTKDVADSVTSNATAAAPEAAQKVEQAFGSPANTPSGKTLDFGVSATTPSTPPSLISSAGGEIDYDQFIWDTLMWKNAVRSVVYLVLGLVLITAACMLFNSSTPLLTGG
eukprot:gene16277-22458_t